MYFYKSFDGRGRGVQIDVFPFVSYGISVLLSFIAFLIWVWKALVGSVVLVWKLFSHEKFCILDSYCFVGMTKKLPLSTHVIMALLFQSLV